MGFEGLDGAGWEVVIVGPQFDGRWWLRSLIKCYYSDNLGIWLNPRHYFNLNIILTSQALFYIYKLCCATFGLFRWAITVDLSQRRYGLLCLYFWFCFDSLSLFSRRGSSGRCCCGEGRGAWKKKKKNSRDRRRARFFVLFQKELMARAYFFSVLKSSSSSSLLFPTHPTQEHS